MGTVASSAMMIELGDGRQVVINSGNGNVYLQLWANGGSLGLCLTVEQATEAWKGLCSAITESIARGG